MSKLGGSGYQSKSGRFRWVGGWAVDCVGSLVSRKKFQSELIWPETHFNLEFLKFDKMF